MDWWAIWAIIDAAIAVVDLAIEAPKWTPPPPNPPAIVEVVKEPELPWAPEWEAEGVELPKEAFGDVAQ